MIKTLDEFKVYNLSMELGEEIWEIVSRWGFLEKDTVGKQLIRACDSISANLSEGLGRFHISETRNFSYYSRGSLFETRTWLTKANKRKLIDDKTFGKWSSDLDLIGKMLNSYINTLRPVSDSASKQATKTQVPSPNH